MDEYKIVVVGSSHVGKSSLTIQFAQNLFVEYYDPTIEDSFRKRIAIDGYLALLEILDTAGQEDLSGRHDEYLRAGQGYVLVYSTTSRTSFDDIVQLKDQLCRANNSDHVPMILVGNKSDLEDQRAVSVDDGAALANSWKIPFFEASARQRVNVDEIFCEVVRQIRTKLNPMINNINDKKNGGKKMPICSII